MTVHERRRDEAAGGVDGPGGFGRDVGLNRGDLAEGAGDVDAAAAVGSAAFVTRRSASALFLAERHEQGGGGAGITGDKGHGEMVITKGSMRKTW
jgi:hypothetical protein